MAQNRVERFDPIIPTQKAAENAFQKYMHQIIFEDVERFYRLERFVTNILTQKSLI